MMIECIRRFDPDIAGDTAARLTKGGMRALDDV